MKKNKSKNSQHTSLLLLYFAQKLLLPFYLFEETLELRFLVFGHTPQLLSAEHQLVPQTPLSVFSLFQFLTEPLELSLQK